MVVIRASKGLLSLSYTPNLPDTLNNLKDALTLMLFVRKINLSTAVLVGVPKR